MAADARQPRGAWVWLAILAVSVLVRLVGGGSSGESRPRPRPPPAAGRGGAPAGAPPAFSQQLASPPDATGAGPPERWVVLRRE